MSNKTKLVGNLIVLGSSYFVSISALAIEPNPIKAGAVDIIPTISADMAWDDNIFQTNLLQRTSRIFTVNPKLQAILESNTNTYSLEAEVIDGTYSDSENDDYTDWRVRAGAELQLSSRNFLEIDASFNSTHEFRGTAFSDGLLFPPTPSEFEETDYGVSYQFGSNGARGRLQLSYSYNDIEYTNNRLLTFDRDVETTTLGAIFFLNIFPTSDLLFEYRYLDIGYITPRITGSLDSEENYFFVGAQWDASEKLDGSVRLGYGEKQFADAALGNAKIPSWEIDLAWSPLSYSVYTLAASNTFEETTNIADSIETQTYGLNWEHGWSSRFSSVLSAQHRELSYTGTVREDTTQTVSANFGYAFARWLDFNISYSYEENESEISLFNYTQSVIALGFEAGL